MNHCRIIDVKKTDSDDLVEPVTLSEVKKWLKVTFNDDDDVITSLITSCRQSVEAFTCTSIVSSQIICNVELFYPNKNSFFSEIELPYGPVMPSTAIIVTMPDNCNNLNTLDIGSDYWFVGEGFLKLRSIREGLFNITYATGLTIIPELLKDAIKTEIAYRYDNRGDADAGSYSHLCDMAKQKAKPYKRFTWL